MKRRIRLTEGDLHRVIKDSVNKVLKESLDNSMLIDDKNRVFDAYKKLVNAMIWENGNIGGEDYMLYDAESKYLEEYGERDIQMLWDNIQEFVWKHVSQYDSF